MRAPTAGATRGGPADHALGHDHPGGGRARVQPAGPARPGGRGRGARPPHHERHGLGRGAHRDGDPGQGQDGQRQRHAPRRLGRPGEGRAGPAGVPVRGRPAVARHQRRARQDPGQRAGERAERQPVQRDAAHALGAFPAICRGPQRAQARPQERQRAGGDHQLAQGLARQRGQRRHHRVERSRNALLRRAASRRIRPATAPSST